MVYVIDVLLFLILTYSYRHFSKHSPRSYNEDVGVAAEKYKDEDDEDTVEAG